MWIIQLIQKQQESQIQFSVNMVIVYIYIVYYYLIDGTAVIITAEKYLLGPLLTAFKKKNITHNNNYEVISLNLDQMIVKEYTESNVCYYILLLLV